jgi:hypothetical protein
MLRWLQSLFAPHPGPTVWYWIAGGLLFAVLVLAVLHRLPSRSKRRLIVVSTFLAGLFYVLEFFLPEKAGWYPTAGDTNPLSPSIQIVGQFVQIIFSFTLGLGTYNLIYFHSRNIRRLRRDWPFSVLFFIAFIVMTVIGFWHDLPTFRPGAVVPEWVTTGWTWLFNGLLVNLDATMFSLLAFYIVSAAYRAFRIRSGEALMLMIAAVIVMLTPLPLGAQLTSWLPADESFWSNFRIERIGNWLLTTVNSAALRAIDFGLGIGGLAMALRIWLSLERGTYFGQEV